MQVKDRELLESIWQVGMRVPDLVRKVAGRVHLRDIQQWARTQRERDAQDTTAPKKGGKQRRLPSWMSDRPLLGLSTQQRDALDALFFQTWRGAIGVRQLWEQLRDDPRQEAAFAASDGREGWISWRQVRRYYNAQESAQLFRRAPTVSQTRAVLPRTLEPFVALQADCISLGSWSYPRNVPQGQQHQYIFVCVDYVTRYCWLCTFRGKLIPSKTINCMKKVVADVRERYGSWPRNTVLRVDNGSADFPRSFVDAVQAHEPNIRVEHGVSNNPNSQAIAEGTVGIWRGVARRTLRNRDTSDWPALLPEMNAMLNNRKNAAIGYTAPADLLQAFDDGDETVIDAALQTMRERASKRRGPGGTVDTALREGLDKVRLVNQAYLKAKLRGNTLKFIPRWSQRVWTVEKRRGGGAAPYEYRLNNDTGAWYPRELLQVVTEVVAAPDVANDDTDDYEVAKVLRVQGQRARVLFRGYPTAEWVDVADVPANLLPT